MPPAKKKRKKEKIQDDEDSSQLEKKNRNLETEKQLLNAERLRLEQEIGRLRTKSDRYTRNSIQLSTKNKLLKERCLRHEHYIFYLKDIISKIRESPLNAASIINSFELFDRKIRYPPPRTEEEKQKQRQKQFYDYLFKIVVFGDDFPSGKTALTQSLTPHTKFVLDQKMTIGVDFKDKSLIVDGQKVKLDIWDISGKERFRSLLPYYFRAARGGLFVYDVTNYATLVHMSDWLSVIRKEVQKDEVFPIIFVGIITDESKEREVQTEEGMKAAKSFKVDGFIECNPKTGENVKEVFKTLTRMMMLLDTR